MPWSASFCRWHAPNGDAPGTGVATVLLGRHFITPHGLAEVAAPGRLHVAIATCFGGLSPRSADGLTRKSPPGRWLRPVAPPPPQVTGPPPPETDSDLPEKLPGIEVVGDEFWFSHLATRRSLRERVVAAHAAQKILVASPATEIKRLGKEMFKRS